MITENDIVFQDGVASFDVSDDISMTLLTPDRTEYIKNHPGYQASWPDAYADDSSYEVGFWDVNTGSTVTEPVPDVFSKYAVEELGGTVYANVPREVVIDYLNEVLIED